MQYIVRRQDAVHLRAFPYREESENAMWSYPMGYDRVTYFPNKELSNAFTLRESYQFQCEVIQTGEQSLIRRIVSVWRGFRIVEDLMGDGRRKLPKI